VTGLANDGKEGQSEDGQEPEGVQKRRHVSRFSWGTVDAAITRRLLNTAYAADPDRPSLRGYTSGGLAELAEKCFGSPPTAEWIDDLAKELVEGWIPNAERASLERLCVLVMAGLGPSAQADLRTKQDMVDFLTRRNRTQKFKHLLRAEFIRAHRVRTLEPARRSARVGPSAPIFLSGSGADDGHVPYPHQIEAHQQLDKLAADGTHVAGLIVLPTGSGKTETIIDWLMDRMEADPTERVLWLSHQQELLQQAVRRFQQRVAVREPGFERVCRLIHAGASSLSTLANDDLDVACVTIQSAGTKFNASKAKRLLAYTQRPTHVVIDEAHHAGSAMYEQVLDVVGPGSISMIGLTATPWPSGLAARRLRKRFPIRIVDADAEELTRQGILARPVLHNIDTGMRMILDDSELHQASTSDLPTSVLDQLNTGLRDHLVVSTWSRNREQWGKTLVFATRIDHANTLTSQLQDAGAPVRAIHSQMEFSPREVIDWFRSGPEDAVLVSVGMLTEGVDLPDAKTAFLARPTTSRILLRQMIGRVLRGPLAGGGREAHLVDFRDRWENFADVLDPEEVIDVDEVDPRDPEKKRRLPPIITDDGSKEIPDEIAAQVNRAQRAVRMLVAGGPDGGLDPLLTTSRLAGWYVLPDRRVAVFEHQQEPLIDLLNESIQCDLTGRPMLTYFGDSHPPYPSQVALRQLVEYVREYEDLPTFEPAVATIGPSDCAAAIFAAGPLHDWERAERIREHWETSLARAAYPSLETFEIAVETELRRLRRHRRGEAAQFDPERWLQKSEAKTKLPRGERSLEPAKLLTFARIPELLPAEMAERLDRGIEVKWTDRVVKNTFGHWSIRLAGKGRGKQVIRINCLLKTSSKQVSDEMLGYLIYHELLHHLLPGMGHSAEFRDCEALWPNAVDHDCAFDTLHERWDLSPERYNRG
jgi:superfamily II DNA or RNA helicase